MEPASSIIAALGGPAKVARIAGVHRTRPWNWTRPKSNGGTGGVIPFEHVPKLLKAAHEAGVELSADDFIPIQAEGATPVMAPRDNFTPTSETQHDPASSDPA